MKKYDIPKIRKVPLKYIAKTQKGKLPKKLVDKNNHTFPIYLSMDVMRGDLQEAKYVEDYESCILANEGDILVLWDGSNAGEIMLAKNGVISSTVALLNVDDSINKRFFYYQLKSKEPILRDSSVGMGIPHVNPQVLNNFSFFLPETKEQTAIASYLDQKTAEIDQLIADKENLLKLYEEEKTALINDLVTGKRIYDGNTWTEPKQVKNSGIDWLGEIPEHWEVKKLKYILESLNNIRVPLSADVRGKMLSRKYDYYGASGVIDKVEDYLFDESLILIGEDGANLLTRSKRLAFIAQGKYWVNNHAHILRPIEGVLEYYCELLELIDYTIWISGSAQPKLTLENLMNINIVAPPIDEQKTIVNYIESESKRLETKIQDTQNLIELLKEYKEALISEVVTGKVKVV